MGLHDLYSQIVKQHSLSGHNRHLLPGAHVVAPGKNPSCGDEIELALVVEDGRIVDGAYTGEGCAISQASTSIMIDLLRGKTPAEGRELAGLFLDMARREKLTEEQLDKLEDAAALENISNMPARVKCATMPWHTLVAALDALEGQG